MLKFTALSSIRRRIDPLTRSLSLERAEAWLENNWKTAARAGGVCGFVAAVHFHGLDPILFTAVLACFYGWVGYEVGARASMLLGLPRALLFRVVPLCVAAWLLSLAYTSVYRGVTDGDSAAQSGAPAAAEAAQLEAPQAAQPLEEQSGESDQAQPVSRSAPRSGKSVQGPTQGLVVASSPQAPLPATTNPGRGNQGGQRRNAGQYGGTVQNLMEQLVGKGMAADLAHAGRVATGPHSSVGDRINAGLDANMRAAMRVYFHRPKGAVLGPKDTKELRKLSSRLLNVIPGLIEKKSTAESEQLYHWVHSSDPLKHRPRNFGGRIPGAPVRPTMRIYGLPMNLHSAIERADDVRQLFDAREPVHAIHLADLREYDKYVREWERCLGRLNPKSYFQLSQERLNAPGTVGWQMKQDAARYTDDYSSRRVETLAQPERSVVADHDPLDWLKELGDPARKERLDNPPANFELDHLLEKAIERDKKARGDD